MRAIRLLGVAGVMLVLGLACSGDKDDVAQDSEDDVTDDSVATADDSEEENTDDTSYGTEFDPVDPLFTVTLADATWETNQGFWTKTSLSANIPDDAQAEVITIIVDGDLRYAGTYPVSSMNYSQTPSQGAPVIYNSDSDPNVTVTVHGFSDELHNNLFATVEGTTDLGGISFKGGEVYNWPPF